MDLFFIVCEAQIFTEKKQELRKNTIQDYVIVWFPYRNKIKKKQENKEKEEKKTNPMYTVITDSVGFAWDFSESTCSHNFRLILAPHRTLYT